LQLLPLIRAAWIDRTPASHAVNERSLLCTGRAR
jgi:hypothetical protein